MRNSSLFLVAGLLLSGFGVGAAQAQSAGATDKGYFGDWKGNPAKSSVSAGGPPPRNMPGTRHHEDLGNGFMLVQIKNFNAKGESEWQNYVVKVDGKQYPVAQANQTKQRTVSFTLVDPYTTTFMFYEDGKPTSSVPGKRTTSKDGKTLTIDQTNTNAQGQTYTSHSEFDKQ